MPFDLVTNCGKRISILNDHSTTKSSTDSKSAPEVVKEASTPVVSSQQHTPVLVQASASASGPAPAPAPAPAHSPASAPAPAAAPAPALAHSHAHAPAPALAPASPIPMAYPHHAPVLPSAAQYYPVYYQPQPVYYYPPPPHPGAPNSAAAAYYRPGPPLQAPPGAGPAPTQVAAPAGYPQPAPAYQYAQGYASYAQVAPPQVASQPVKPAQAGPVVSRPVKKYTCHCMRSFTTSGHLARHMRIHTGEKNYVCPYDGCGARFSRQDNCMQHYRTHMGGRGRLNRKRQSSAGATNTQSGADSPASKKPNLGSTTNSHTESVPSDSPAPGIASSRSQSSSGFSGLSGHVAGTTTTTTTTLLAA